MKDFLQKFDYTDIVWTLYIFVSYTFYMKTNEMPINIVALFLEWLPVLFIGKSLLFDKKMYWKLDIHKYFCFFWYFIFLCYEYYISKHGIYNSSIWTAAKNNLILFFCMCLTITSKRLFEKFLYDYAVGILGFAIIAWVTSPISTYGTLDFGGFPQRQRNTTAYAVGIAFAIFVYFYIKEKNKFNAFCAIICAIVTLLTGSRKGVLQLVLPFIVMMFCQENAKKLMKYVFIILIVGGALVLILLNNKAFMSVYGERMLAIFNDAGDTSDASVYARNMLKLIGFNAFLQNPIWGYGLGCSWTLVEESGFSFVNYFHNNFIEILCCGGIIGFLFYHLIIVKNTIVLLINRKKDEFNFVLLTICLTFLILSWGQVTVYYSHFTLVIFMVVQCGVFLKEDKNENNNCNCIQ